VGIVGKQRSHSQKRKNYFGKNFSPVSSRFHSDETGLFFAQNNYQKTLFLSSKNSEKRGQILQKGTFLSSIFSHALFT
jgi:hypothetical protein